MKNIGFIIPYFGKFNNYFQLFLNSCKYNHDCDWIIFTDDRRYFNYPDNVIVHYCLFSEIQCLFRNKFEFQIKIERPYKLCDFRPAYGYIFSDYLNDYRFWGYCDVDLIWGNISHFINVDLLNMYDKIGIMGHCTIYKNDDQIKKIFLKSLNGVNRAKTVFSLEQNQSFDEEFRGSINNIFEEYNLAIDYKEYEANIYTKSSDFRITRMEINHQHYIIEKKSRSFFVWNKGELNRYIILNNELSKEEFMYIHMQSRPMHVKISEESLIYKIIPNAFEELEHNKILNNDYMSIKVKNFNFHYFRLRSKNFIDKIQKKLRKKL